MRDEQRQKETRLVFNHTAERVWEYVATKTDGQLRKSLTTFVFTEVTWLLAMLREDLILAELFTWTSNIPQFSITVGMNKNQPQAALLCWILTYYMWHQKCVCNAHELELHFCGIQTKKKSFAFKHRRGGCVGGSLLWRYRWHSRIRSSSYSNRWMRGFYHSSQRQPFYLSSCRSRGKQQTYGVHFTK